MPLPLLRLNGAAGSLRCRGRLAAAPLATRRSLASAAAPRRVCVVGSGPAGMYAASALLRAAPDVHVDVVERLCTPFGLIRFGVAPDHPEMKVMAEKFDAVAADERVRLIGNVEVGRDVSVAQLRRFYDGLIFAFGADGDRSIGLEGEHEIDGIHAARDFVAWYNGLPSHRSLDFKLDEVESVVVVGNGNVATDVARILLMPTTMLARTDITAHALDALERSTVKRVTIVGRRGPAQAAWTGKELREILNTLPDVAVEIEPAELAIVESPQDKAEMKAARVKKRCVDMLKKKLAANETAAATTAAAEEEDDEESSPSKALALRFCLSPSVLHAGDASGSGGGSGSSSQGRRLRGVSFTRMALEGDAGKQRAVPAAAAADGEDDGGEEEEEIGAELLLRSVGYRSVAMEGLPWNDAWGVVPTDAEGRVINHADAAAAAAAAAAEGGGGSGGAGVAASAWPCMYATGWLRRGPSGVISTNKGDAEQVVEALLQDWEGGATARCYGGGAEDDDRTEHDLVAWLTKAGGGREGGGGVTVCDYAGWHRIDIAECAAARTDAPREKIVDPDRLFSVATAATAAASS